LGHNPPQPRQDSPGDRSVELGLEGAGRDDRRERGVRRGAAEGGGGARRGRWLGGSVGWAGRMGTVLGVVGRSWYPWIIIPACLASRSGVRPRSRDIGVRGIWTAGGGARG